MIKLTLPKNYQSKVEKVIKSDENEEDIVFAMEFYMDEINWILNKREISRISAGQIRVSPEFNTWLFNIAEDEEIEMDCHSWGLMLVNQGPATDEKVGEYEILFLETEEEYRSYPGVLPEVTETINLSILEKKAEYTEIVFMDSADAQIAFEILENQNEEQVINYLSQWDKGEYHHLTDDYKDKIGTDDTVYKGDEYILAYNTDLNYITLYRKLEEKFNLK